MQNEECKMQWKVVAIKNAIQARKYNRQNSMQHWEHIKTPVAMENSMNATFISCTLHNAIHNNIFNAIKDILQSAMLNAT